VIENERITYLNDASKKNGSFIVYWMQQSQRTRFNHALQYAIKQANAEKLPLIVYFGLTETYPEANRRHYQFMLEGLKHVKTSLETMGVKFVIKKQDPSKGIVTLADESTMVIVDRGYTKIQRLWRSHAAAHINCPLIQVESDVVVPIETTSQKEEYEA
jgi:deoxyribodipyrimidine photo-lyase